MEIAPSGGDEDDPACFPFLHLFLLNCGDACLAKVMEDSLDGERDEDDNTADNSNNPGGGILQILSLFSLCHLFLSPLFQILLLKNPIYTLKKKKKQRIKNRINHRKRRRSRVELLRSMEPACTAAVYNNPVEVIANNNGDGSAHQQSGEK
ncbi:hypothetical protein SLA2020_524640 [Shorea laevis]